MGKYTEINKQKVVNFSLIEENMELSRIDFSCILRFLENNSTISWNPDRLSILLKRTIETMTREHPYLHDVVF